MLYEYIYVYIYDVYKYIPSSPSSVGPVGQVPPSRSVWSHGGVGWGWGGQFMVISMVPVHFYPWPLAWGLEPTLEPPTGGTIY